MTCGSIGSIEAVIEAGKGRIVGCSQGGVRKPRLNPKRKRGCGERASGEVKAKYVQDSATPRCRAQHWAERNNYG